MEQCLEPALTFRIDRAAGHQVGPFGDDARNEVMLISKASDAEGVLAGPRGDAFPIDVGSDVGATYLLKGGGELSMPGAHLDAGLEIVADVTVIDKQDVTAFEISGDVVHPIERGLVEDAGRLESRRSFHKYELVATKIDGFAGQIDRQRVEQFVGKMDTSKGFDRFDPFHFPANRFERFLLSFPPEREWLHNLVTKRGEKFRPAGSRRFQNISGELAIVRALLDDDEIVDAAIAPRLAQSLPDFGKLRAPQAAKNRANANVGEVIAFAADRGAPTRVVAVLRVIKGLLHKPGERDGAVLADMLADQVGQLGVQSENVQRRTSNVQYWKRQFDVER